MNERKDPWSVGAWMTPNPATVSPEELARQAFVTMRTEGYRHLIVVEDGAVVGIVTDRDLRCPTISSEPDGWNDYYRLSDDYTVRDIMSDEVQSVRPRDTLEKALKLVHEKKIGGLPVLDKNDALIGILTSHDLMGAFREVLKETGEALRR